MLYEGNQPDNAPVNAVTSLVDGHDKHNTEDTPSGGREDSPVTRHHFEGVRRDFHQVFLRDTVGNNLIDSDAELLRFSDIVVEDMDDCVVLVLASHLDVLRTKVCRGDLG